MTVLSSQSGEDLASPVLARLRGKRAGLDGVVVSGADVADVRQVCGEEFCLVVPGIRPHGGNGDDQVRVLTPSAALDAGADYLVVGRPITGSDDPVGRGARHPARRALSAPAARCSWCENRRSRAGS